MTRGRILSSKTIAAFIPRCARFVALRVSVLPMIVRTAGDFVSLREAWSELILRDRRATPFQSPQWLLPWWNHFRGDGELAVLATLDSRGVLAGLLPLYVIRDEEESLGLFVGSGVSDYLDTIGDIGAIGEVLDEVECHLWDFHQLRADSPLLAPSTDVAGWDEEVENHESTFTLDLSHAVDSGALLSPHARKHLRYSQRLLERQGKVTTQTADRGNVDRLMEAFFALHTLRWGARGLPGVLADPETQSFHRDVAHEMLAAGMLRLHSINVDDHPRAVFYGFTLHDTTYYYLSGFDPAFEEVGIGHLVVAHAIQRAIDERAHTFDFLRGDEAYKRRWGAIERETLRKQLVRRL